MGPCKVTRKESQAQGHGRSLSIVVTFIGVKEMLHPWGCRGWAGSISNCPDVLANPPVYLGTSWLSFKLSNTFPGVLQECTRPSPYPVSFLDLLGFGALILSKHFHGFSQSRVLPFIVTTLSSAAHGSKFCFVICILCVHLVEGPPLCTIMVSMHMPSKPYLPLPRPTLYYSPT